MYVKEWKKNENYYWLNYAVGFGGKHGIQKDRQDKVAVGFEYHEKLALHESQRDYSKGFGGKYGVEKDRVDKNAVGWEDHEKLHQHESQTDYKKGFGGKFGIQEDRQDKNAKGWDEPEKVAPHESQIDYKKGFGGKFGVQEDRRDKSAKGWDEPEKVAPHESQIDYKKGFGGKFGIQEDRKDKSAAGWDEHEKLQQHESQIDYKKGFGGQFGLQLDRQDKSALGFEHHEKLAQHESQKDYAHGFGGKHGLELDRQDKSAYSYAEPEREKTDKKEPERSLPKRTTASSLKARFEQLAMSSDEEKVRMEKERRKREDEELKKRQEKEEEERQKRVAEEWRKRDALNDQMTPEALEAETRKQEKYRYSAGAAKTHRTPVGAVAIMPGIQPSNQPVTPEVRTEEKCDEEGLPEEPEHQAPVPVLPTFVPPARSPASSSQFNADGDKKSIRDLIRKQPSSSDENENDEDWNDDANEVPPISVPSEGKITAKGVTDTSPYNKVDRYDYTPDEVPPPAPTQNVHQPQQSQQTPTYQLQYDEPPLDSLPPTEVSDPLTGPTHPLSTTGGLTAVAIFDYQKQDDDEISFEPGDMITNIEQIDAGWWRGVCNNQFGLFPANYVELR